MSRQKETAEALKEYVAALELVASVAYKIAPYSDTPYIEDLREALSELLCLDLCKLEEPE